MFTRGPVIRARESSTDMYAAIDLVSDKLVRRVKKYHDKIHGKTRHGHDKIVAPVEPAPELAPVAAAAALADEMVGEAEHAGDNGRIVKTKQFALKPMSIHEATLQMELVGHDFFVFTNAESNRTNVVYRRNDGHYGLIEPAENCLEGSTKGRRVSTQAGRLVSRGARRGTPRLSRAPSACAPGGRRERRARVVRRGRQAVRQWA